ncbi:MULTISPECIES: WGR domain-containing protein, partial [unclassified Labrenzia]|uniref:WGR domain-containing protein n=1 Tax=unclassified Labrenzia TaxID=2648686 RepID=UPI00336C003E
MLDAVRLWLRNLRLWHCSSPPHITVMNPFLRIDSNHSLDRSSAIFDTAVMEPGDDLLLLKRVDPGRNMNRFYHLSVEPTLFGGFAVRRTWGRLGTRGRTRLDLFADVSSALAHQQKLAAQK